MEGNESPRKVGVQIAVGNEDDDDDPVTPESNVVKAKLEAHNIKQMGALLKPFPLSQVDAMLKKHLRSAMFQTGELFSVPVAPLVLHGGIWRWMPDFALKPVPAETGRLHLGLLVGPYVVDWTDSHLVAIRTVTSCQPLVLVNLGQEVLYSGTSEEAVSKLLRSLATVIVNWNTSHKFDLKKSSSVSFVEEMLKAVAAKTVIPARIKDVVSEAQGKGGGAKFEAVFQADWAVLPGEKKAKKHKFKNHAELDEWMLAMRQLHPDLETKFPEDWNYLLLLDRCFWCGIEATDVNTAPERDRPRADGCAFGPPAFLKVMELELGSGPKKNQVIKKKGSERK